MVTAFFNGLGIGAALIMAIGAQGAFVLSQALKRHHHLLVAMICLLCDAILIGLGVAGVGAMISESELLMAVARYGGGAFLLLFGLQSLRRAIKGSQLEASGDTLGCRRTVIIATLAVTLLNPHVYLDALVLLGSIGAQFGDERWFFFAGTVTASTLWFFGLSLGAARLAPVLARPAVWRGIDLLVWALMWGIGLKLLLVG
ncbi:Lysine exporter protein (LYSE/YGGA) [Ferrimonas balearica DSM 9799]|uniref:Lysine exporter protein (LYSE/YGGA) n=1 Tax=Ferrimonas balearica (strain DSM 9799 / CCM 4581 / KCTC 23876 / PAT) TaxID=550540 RepID=E1SQA0_FERBD|nr:LysE/ArgO family amino acid transporter [Ferrimonas balearica]MBY6019577.1 LysE/ArgO family amino acid transporter [Halomonas denitrificans]ADN77871.1 Lysine exporter protein (LYSE/YGGA) [Ferrimonas balearica DSM 9799]MBW3141432.1 LysE/ArgO family amino acid transporter [Ferrimonas balearica]MBW3166402.1 LysE/ArgO family amino acid transporter [Ferrimonas balearica]MBY5982191.1 LysE/ArgO family amino acid transporter [Ferrimonas balearica]